MKNYQLTNNKLIIWKKQDNTYYHKVVKTHYADYQIGYKNSYGHEVVYIITHLEFRIKKTPFKKKLKRKLINYIEKM